jgi:hypothetical protein
MSKILVISSPFPFPPKGANAQDRAAGILQYLRLGFDVKLITSIAKPDDQEAIAKTSHELGIEIIPFREPSGVAGPIHRRMVRLATRLAKNPLMIDGAAGNFANPELNKILDLAIKNWHPDIVWFERSYTWPLHVITKKYSIPVVTRSHNFEPIDFLESHGHKPQTYFMCASKLISELMTIHGSDLIFAISPQETRMYEKSGAKNVSALPLRHLPTQLEKKVPGKVSTNKLLNIFFTGSTYKVPRNKKTLGFILKDVIPRVEKSAPNSFCFHIFGDKLPAEYRNLLGKNTIYRGFVEDLDFALDEMNIALGNNLTIAGTQGKIFEPLARGFPIVTSPRGLAGYTDFKNEEHLLFAQNADEFAWQLIRLKDANLRKRIAIGARTISQKLFSQKAIDEIILQNFSRLP